MGVKEAVSQNVIFPIWRRTLPVWQRSGPAYRRGLQIRTAYRGWTRAEREAWSLQELRALVRHAARQVPFYRARFRAIGFDAEADFGFADYAQLPPLERHELVECGEALLAEQIDRTTLNRDSTGGSTGEPVHIWKDQTEIGWAWSGTEYFEQQIGSGAGRRITRIWGHHLDLRGQDRLRKRVRLWLGNIEYLDCFRLSPTIFAEWHAHLVHHKPEVLVCYASAIYLFAEWLREQGITPTYPSRAITTGAEKLAAQQRAVVAQVFRVPVFETYGARDTGLIAFQRAANSPTLAVDASNMFVEPAEPVDGAPSEILVTKLHSFAMPLLRYRLGDMARFPADARPGWPSFELLDVTGRTLDHIVLPGGRVVHAAEFPHMFKDFDIRLYQVRQMPTGDVLISIVPGAHFDHSSEARILHLCSSNLAPMQVELRLVDQIDRTRAGKLRPVISELRG